MSKLIYISNTSLDGYIEDEAGKFDWGNPEGVFDCITELVRPMRTYLLGRRLYETMTHWDAPVDGYPPEQRDFARIWQKVPKIVYSRTLTSANTDRVRIEGDFNAEAMQKLKLESEGVIGIGGAQLASLALEAELLDECHLFLNPVLLGRGKPAFQTSVRRELDLIETGRFDTGVVHVRYRIRTKH